jgi:hypothetical protein
MWADAVDLLVVYIPGHERKVEVSGKLKHPSDKKFISLFCYHFILKPFFFGWACRIILSFEQK